MPHILSGEPMPNVLTGDEAAFRQWITTLPWYHEFIRQYGEAPNLNTPDYDYRAAYRAGVKPERDPYDSNRYHWPDVSGGKMLKSRDHPTMWMQRYMQMYGVDPRAIGIAENPFAGPIRRR